MNDSLISGFELQPTNLSNELVRLLPLKLNDFEKLFKVASDPLIWEQHPTRNRYERDVFEIYFNGAIESKGAFCAFDNHSNEPIGCSRVYYFNKEDNSVKIGYTFISRKYWGKKYNKSMKVLMINHAFKFLDNIFFEIGSKNIRSQMAIEKLGAVKIGQKEMVYVGEPTANVNFIYKIDKKIWEKKI